jgi:hypothetical protein
MIDGIVAVSFAVIIVVGMATGQIWSKVVAEGMPILRDWLAARLDAGAEWPVLDRSQGSREELNRRIDHLEEQVEFLEALLDDDARPMRPLK